MTISVDIGSPRRWVELIPPAMSNWTFGAPVAVAKPTTSVGEKLEASISMPSMAQEGEALSAATVRGRRSEAEAAEALVSPLQGGLRAFAWDHRLRRLKLREPTRASYWCLLTATARNLRWLAHSPVLPAQTEASPPT